MDKMILERKREAFFSLRSFFLHFGEDVECGYARPEEMLKVIRMIGGSSDFSVWGDFVRYMKKDLPESERAEIISYFLEGLEALEMELENESYFGSLMQESSEKIISVIKKEETLISLEEESGANELLKGLGIQLDIRAFAENIPLMPKEFLQGILDLLEGHKTRWIILQERLSG